MDKTCSYTFDPSTVDETTVTEQWSCPHTAHLDDDINVCPYHMDEDTRDELDITPADITEQLIDILKHGQPEDREFIGATLPALDLTYVDIEAEDQDPTDFRHAAIEDFDAERAKFEEQLDFRHATLGRLNLNNADLEEGILCESAVINGLVSLYEAVISGDDTDFTNAVCSGVVNIDEADFTNDLSFDHATFEDKATFRGAKFHGRANSIGDNTTFDNAVFHGKADFTHATFEYATFEDVVFEAEADFKEVIAEGGVKFINSIFKSEAIFDEATFNEDVSFRDCTFNGKASFLGVEFNGGAAVLEDDISFDNAVFNRTVTFKEGTFGESDITEATFNDDVNFRRAVFTDKARFDNAIFKGEFDGQRCHFKADVSFSKTTFEGIADFDEVQFDGDGIFTGTIFNANAVFRGAEFYGGTNYHEEDAVFRNAEFYGNAQFTDVHFTSADFTDTTFMLDVDFTEAIFTDELNIKASSIGKDTYLNFAEASIPDGNLIQPDEGWVRFDLTEATIGDIAIGAEDPEKRRQLLDYFRFCNTTFDGFDFSEHTGYLDRNDWNLHDFAPGDITYNFALEMTAENIEKTYLKAKQSASAQSNQKAAGEFRVKRQYASRNKYIEIATDSTEDVKARFQNGLRAAENAFLGITCGYGLRLYRIAGTFAIFPLFSAVLFAYGGKFFETGAGQVTLSNALTVEGLNTLAINTYFSYITFLTIGYGNIGPQGLGARFLAALLVYMNVILAGLFIYALIKRNEV